VIIQAFQSNVSSLFVSHAPTVGIGAAVAFQLKSGVVDTIPGAKHFAGFGEDLLRGMGILVIDLDMR
jgi:hypothetical protein